MKFLLDENVPLSVRKVIHALGHETLLLYDFNKLGIQNGEVAELALRENAVILTLDSDFLQLKKDLQKKSRVVYIQIHPRDPKKIREIFHTHLKNYALKLNKPCKLIITEDKVVLEIL